MTFFETLASRFAALTAVGTNPTAARLPTVGERCAHARGGSCPRTAPPVLGAKSPCHGCGACAAGGAAPFAATHRGRKNVTSGLNAFMLAFVEWRATDSKESLPEEWGGETDVPTLRRRADVFGQRKVDLTGTREVQQVTRLAAAQGCRDEDITVRCDPLHYRPRCSARCSCTASVAIWMASSSDWVSAISCT